MLPAFQLETCATLSLHLHRGRAFTMTSSPICFSIHRNIRGALFSQRQRPPCATRFFSLIFLSEPVKHRKMSIFSCIYKQCYRSLQTTFREYSFRIIFVAHTVGIYEERMMLPSRRPPILVCSLVSCYSRSCYINSFVCRWHGFKCKDLNSP